MSGSEPPRDAGVVPIPSPGETVWFGTAGSPLVVVVPDAYGRLPALDPLAQALADQGLRVAVLDLYDGVATVDVVTADALLEHLAPDRALDSVAEAIEDGRASGSRRTGIVGFSSGGAVALTAGVLGLADAVVAYYALLPPDHGVLPCPVLLHLAEEDDRDTGDEFDSFVAGLKDHGTPVAVHRYVGTRHSFANASVPGLADTRAAALAFARTAAFLLRHLAD